MTDTSIHLLRGNDVFSIELQLKKISTGLGSDFDSSLISPSYDLKDWVLG